MVCNKHQIIKNISICYDPDDLDTLIETDKDIIRHKLVGRIVAAYKKQDDRNEQRAD